MKIAWSGQHTRGKALPILLRALAFAFERGLANPSDFEVHVLGVGVMTEAWKKLAKKLGVDQGIVWHGWIQKTEAEAIVGASDVFVITSLKDLTSAVLMEALGRGKPVVCLDHCGFATAIDETCGIKIPVGKPESVIAGFAEALVKLLDASLLKRLSDGALARSKKYLWSNLQAEHQKILGCKGKRVLVSAYTVSPYKGSEPGMGWRYLQAVAAENEVWAIVEEEKWRKDLEKYCAENDDFMTKVHWIFIHKPRARWLRKIWPPSYYWFYRVWQWRAFKVAQKLHQVHQFDLAYQLTMTGFREPGYLWKLDCPFAWGPIGGNVNTDWRLLPLAGFSGAVEYTLRNIINWVHCHFLIRPRLAARKAAIDGRLMASTGEIADGAEKLWGARASVLCENGVAE